MVTAGDAEAPRPEEGALGEEGAAEVGGERHRDADPPRREGLGLRPRTARARQVGSAEPPGT